MKQFLLFFVLLTAASCVSVDIEKKVKTSSGAGSMEKTGTGGGGILVVPVETEPVIIEKPVYVPQGQQLPPQARGRAAVEAAAKQGTAQPQDYSASTMLYDYHRDFVYEVYCQPIRITDLVLKPGEKVVEAPYAADSERWMLGAGISYENGITVQHIYVKPTQANIESSLIINTNERVYHLILRSYQNIHMPRVRWRYYETVLPAVFGQAGQGQAAQTAAAGDGETVSADPRFMSFNYRITYGLFKKPRWLPILAYDDGKKTFITFPESVLQTELPAVFEDRADVVNYRAARNLMIIDKLIEKITVKIGNRQVTIEKKRGK